MKERKSMVLKIINIIGNNDEAVDIKGFDLKYYIRYGRLNDLLAKKQCLV